MGGGGQVQPGGGVRSVSRQGGGSGPAGGGGSGPARGGSVSWGGSASCALLRAVCLFAFTQEDFLVLI